VLRFFQLVPGVEYCHYPRRPMADWRFFFGVNSWESIYVHFLELGPWYLGVSLHTVLQVAKINFDLLAAFALHSQFKAIRVSSHIAPRSHAQGSLCSNLSGGDVVTLLVDIEVRYCGSGDEMSAPLGKGTLSTPNGPKAS
jgi:hypothetical protein